MDYRLELGDGDIEYEEPIIYDINDRYKHFYCIGRSGMGKSSVMELMAKYDMDLGLSVIFIDPKGESTKRLYHQAQDKSKVIYVDADHPIGLNPLQKQNYSLDNIIEEFVEVLDVITTLTSINPESSLRMKELMDMALKSFSPEQLTLQYLHDFLKYEYVRRAHKFPDIDKANYWTEHDRKQGQYYVKKYYHETADSVTSRIYKFINNAYLNRFMQSNDFDVPTFLEKGQSLMLDISQFRQENRISIANLIIYAIATHCTFSQEKKPLMVYIDECQVCISEVFNLVLQFGRGAQVGFTLANHNFAEIKQRNVLDTVLGIVSNYISFQCGPDEGKKMAEIYDLKQNNFTQLDKFEAWVRLGKNNCPVETFEPLMKEVPDIDLDYTPPKIYNFLADESDAWIVFDKPI